MRQSLQASSVDELQSAASHTWHTPLTATHIQQTIGALWCYVFNAMLASLSHLIYSTNPLKFVLFDATTAATAAADHAARRTPQDPTLTVCVPSQRGTR